MPSLARSLLAVAALTLSLATTGCLSHLPPRSDEHTRIDWAPSWDAAMARAEREGKPILAVLVAGEMCGRC